MLALFVWGQPLKASLGKQQLMPSMHLLGRICRQMILPWDGGPKSEDLSHPYASS